MIIEHDSVTKEIRIECDNCNRSWIYQEDEIIMKPYPHVVCPVCNEWTFIPSNELPLETI